MENFVIEGGHPIKGEVTPAGSKNEALAIIPAALLTDERVVLRNLPAIGDVATMLGILEALGASVDRQGDHEAVITARKMDRSDLAPDLSRRIRGSFMLAGPMLNRLGEVTLPHPGGDRIGRRRVDTHLLALAQLGAQIEVGETSYTLRCKGRLKGCDIFLDEASVTGTENAVMAACMAQGATVVRNAASEPHVQQLCRFLNKLGANISGIGSNVLSIEGVDRLHGGDHAIASDYIEVGSFIGLAAVTRGELTIRRVSPDDLRMILLTFERFGISVEIQGDDVHIPGNQELRVVSDLHGAIPKIDDSPWPGFPADLLSIATVVATQAEGTVLIFEKMFDARMFFVDRLIEMGAKIVLCDPHRAVVVGPSRLHGEEIATPDIRAGMALLIAGLCADGRSVIHNIWQVERGYEKIDERLRALGACIERVSYSEK